MIEARFRLAFADFTLETDLQLPERGVTALFGHSGSGKTTLLRCIAGLQRPDSGFLQVRGQVWQDSAKGVFLPTHQRPLGYVFQEASLFPHLTARKNMDYGRKRAAQSANDAELAALVEMLGIGHVLDKIPAQLSGGERQRVGIARALALKPHKVRRLHRPLGADLIQQGIQLRALGRSEFLGMGDAPMRTPLAVVGAVQVQIISGGKTGFVGPGFKQGAVG